MTYAHTIRDLLADCKHVLTIAGGEFGCKTELSSRLDLPDGFDSGMRCAHVPAICDATLPRAVVVVVAAALNCLRADLKMTVGRR